MLTKRLLKKNIMMKKKAILKIIMTDSMFQKVIEAKEEETIEVVKEEITEVAKEVVIEIEAVIEVAIK